MTHSVCATDFDKVTPGPLFCEWKDISKHKGLKGALGFPKLLRWLLALTLAGFQPRTLDIPSDHLTTRPYRTFWEVVGLLLCEQERTFLSPFVFLEFCHQDLGDSSTWWPCFRHLRWLCHRWARERLIIATCIAAVLIVVALGFMRGLDPAWLCGLEWYSL